jgi:hypothetical protein
MFDRTWEYPFRYGSVEDFMYLATQRDGTQAIGSFFYAGGGSAVGAAAPLVDEYVADGGDPKYRLSDIRRFPRVGQFPFWLLESRVAGLHPLHVGDVGGPTISYNHWFNGNNHNMNLGWKWTKDPRFAWVVVNLGKRGKETDAEWKELTDAAKTITRNPFLSNRTRVLTDWGAILEGNAGQDDFRFRHAARVRIGTGAGHAHGDLLDLGIWSMGLAMSSDMGARGGYGRPASSSPHIHNLVTIDKNLPAFHAWAREVADLGDLQYVNIDAFVGWHLEEGKVSRQIALIETDPGKPSAQPPSNPLHDSTTTYGKDITLPKAYCVDFFRVYGGKEHSYNFHGPTEDQFETNVVRGSLDEADTEWLKDYVIAGEQWAGKVEQDVLQATWRLGREPVKFHIPGRGDRVTRPPEPAMMGANYDPESPRKFLRVHVPGQKGAKVRSGVAVSGASDPNRTDGDWLRQMHVVRNTEKGETSSLFAAVWEPYAGEPSVESVALEGDPSDANSFAAVHVQMKNGRRDLVFSDSAKPQSRTLKNDVQVEGSFAFVSYDAGGFREAVIVGGRSLKLPELTVETPASTQEATVKTLDFLNNTATLDRPLSTILSGRFFEVGTSPTRPFLPRRSNFEVSKIDGNTVTWRKGADGGSGVVGSMQTLPELKKSNPNGAGHWGRRGATDADTLLRMDIAPGIPLGRNNRVTIAKTAEGPQITGDIEGDFVLVNTDEARQIGLVPGDRIRFFEIAVGDVFRTNTQVAITREKEGTYRVETDTPCAIILATASVEVSYDGGKTWASVPTAPESSGKPQLHITPEQVAAGNMKLRWK